MGVAGCGKTTVGRLLAERLGAAFADADGLHSPESVAKMAAGRPLTDEDRYPWLERVGQLLGRETEGQLVMACSALRRDYRDRLRSASGRPLFFVHLTGDADLLAHRMQERDSHFMPVSLLRSQLDTLEPLDIDEDGATVSITAHPSEIVTEAELYLRLQATSSS
ncbi:gluconate kinase [Microbacterium sp. TPD7012]|nr:gluconate kinase [Microbacterium sp. TPD7012]